MVGRLVYVGDVVEVEVEEAGFGSLVLDGEGDEVLLEVEGDGGGVGVDGEEAAAGFVVGEEIAFDGI